MEPSSYPSPNILLILTSNLLVWITKQFLAQVLSFVISDSHLTSICLSLSIYSITSPSIVLLLAEKSKIDSNNSLETLILQACITSRIDFCNNIYNGLPKESLKLLGLPDYHIASIRSIQNACAKATTKASRSDSVTEQRFLLNCSLPRSAQTTKSFWCAIR